MIVKEHKSRGRLILAICDDDIIGKKFSEGELQLDLRGDFYKGVSKNEKEVAELAKKAYMINMAGKGAVNLGIKLDLILKKNIIKIEGIPHAQYINC